MVHEANREWRGEVERKINLKKRKWRGNKI